MIISRVHLISTRMEEQTTGEKDLGWGNIGFSYMPTDKCYVANYKGGAWSGGAMTSDPNVVINKYAGILQYCQEIFEGLKAYTTENGSIVTLRPDLNAERMTDSTRRLEMPPFLRERFLEAVGQVVRINATWVPPFGSGTTLYLRPYMFVSGPAIGIKPSQECRFRLFGTPVGPCFKGGARPLTLCVSGFDRAVPSSISHVKAGLNCAMSLHTSVTAHAAGYDENMFLDLGTRTYIEETGGANFLFVTKDGEVVAPKSDSILPSITRRSLVYVAEYYLGLKVTQRPVKLSELGDFTECELYGTTAVISSVDKIVDHGRKIYFPSGMDAMGPVTKRLCDTLTGIQMGTIGAPEGWIRKIVQQWLGYYKV